ncbi:NADPH-dependent 2,4-dienoyl-CoA reductase, sulfur reductase [Tissierella praeacuta DSM 18095]|uniref:NADPH-dependent 2,4-dienoyl-CoA reductase, sulfur reductase n=1 Tax=Tissierella praeacuta DSM 18095 TaxID=1123404 RepID=A0A1M4UH76_9FIRM|nr:FAD-dependent oxidoreductase [Tissierella praeacuta]SHE56101.1 NADPH-dependent 2,4-dienoyl-CoA reductase, sulfur reductase [Tissierella praeacuta DSM 18095]SUP03729.1 NADH peroxidase [Tissierella praeacuta]
MKVLIIGGVAAGTKVAAKLKRENRDTEVTILTESKDISYAGCGLPYYVGNVIPDRDELIVNTPESFMALTGANVLTETKVTKVNPKENTVEALDLKTNRTNTYEYDKLVIASGAQPIKPPLEGIDLDGVFFMRTPDDAISLRNAIESGKIKRAVVVGGGFIGLEVAENLALQGINSTVIDMADMVPPGFEPEFTEYIADHLAEHGIMIFTGTKLEAIVGEDKVEKIKTDKRTMKADAVILSIGIRANTAFLADTDIELMPNRTIKVNSNFQTNYENIYAVGDCATVTNKITGEPAWSPMGSTANIAGRILAKNINGESFNYGGVLGTAVAKLPNLNIGRTGLTENAAKDAGYNVISVVTVVDDKAHYYPDSSFFIVKMLADRNTKKLLGLQVLGKGAVDKMVDIAVTAITLGATLEDIENMDLAYAPPFSTAIHPFAHTVNVLLNKINGNFNTITPYEFANGKAEEYKIIDASIVPSLKGIPYIDLSKVEGELPEYKKDEKLLLVCSKGKRAYMLQNRLKYFGYTNTLVLEGGTILNKI